VSAVSAAPAAARRDAADRLLDVRGLHVSFKGRRRKAPRVHAVNGVDLTIGPRETLGLVGESGSGKSTVGRALLRLVDIDAGTVELLGRDLAMMSSKDLRTARRDVQMVFQDPYSSMNPAMFVADIIGEPLHVYKLVANRKAGHERVAALLSQVGLFPYMAERYPHELSGGQRQRVGIARALALEPTFIVCDEPVSALDVSIQGQIINLLEDLQDRLGLSYLFIAHDLAVVRHISTRVAVMYLGNIVEVAPKRALYAEPLHPYTQALLASVPVTRPSARRKRAAPLKGDIPSALAPPPGCRFHTRCPLAEPLCREVEPALAELRPGHHVACHVAARGA